MSRNATVVRIGFYSFFFFYVPVGSHKLCLGKQETNYINNSQKIKKKQNQCKENAFQ